MKINVVLLLFATTLITVSCHSSTDSCATKKLLGHWKSETSTCQLTFYNEYKNTLVKVDCDSFHEQDIVNCAGGQLKCNVTMLGDSNLTLSGDGKQLLFMGQKFIKN
jgi:hypothetical protein